MNDYWLFDSLFLIAINAGAGFFSASIWFFFSFERWKQNRLVLAAIDMLMAIVGLSIGIAYLAFAITDHPPTWVRYLVFPVLVIPALLHLYSWIKARRFMAETRTDG